MHLDTACNWHSNETVTLRKHVTKYKHMRKWFVEFLRKFENRGIKIDRVKIRINKFINLLYFCTVLRSIVTGGDFPSRVHIEKSMAHAMQLIMFTNEKYK